MMIEHVKPEFGGNYDVGYIGFTFRETALLNQGIAYFTRWDRLSSIQVAHAFVVDAEDEGIEALLSKGVVRSSLAKKFDDDDMQVFFRKPRGWTPEIGARIAATAAGCVGQAYDYKLIAAQAIEGSFLGRFLNKVMEGSLETKVAELFDDEDSWMCAELAAYSMDEQPEYVDRGVLKKANAAISPQELFADEVIFEHWKNEGKRE